VELAATAERQAELVAQLKTRYVGESSTLAQKDKEIAFLRAQLAEAQAEVGSFKTHADKVTNEKLTAMAELQQARGDLHQFRANLTWAIRYLEEKKEEHFANINEFHLRMETITKVQEEKLRGLSIDYDEELYPHLMSTIAERRYVLTYFPVMLPYYFCRLVSSNASCSC
jgi:chromosome segregation ATPase